MVTKKTKELEQYKQAQTHNTESETKIQELSSKNQTLEAMVKSLTSANDRLKKDNKDLKNIVDRIKLQLVIDMKKLLQYQDSEIRQAAIKLFKSTLG
jgi:outer membrane murein-binding lipoprotein Lpp